MKGETDRAALAGGGLLRHIHWPVMAHVARLDSRCDPRWLWHLPACLGGVLGNVWGVWAYWWRGKDKKLITELQVKQTLKDDTEIK